MRERNGGDILAAQWREANKREPCPICGRNDWCRVNGAWVVCRRVDNGRGIHRVDKSGADYWLYRLDGSLGPVSVNSLPEIPQAEPERADDATLYKVYTSLLRALSLTDAHRENLRRRGLTDDEIDKRRYRSLPLQGRAAIAKQLATTYGAETVLKVPGFYVKEGADGKRWLSLAGASGILIPVRDLAGQIVGIKVRADEPGENSKYTWVSSSKHEGPGPGNRPHVPTFSGEKTEQAIIRVTEGELKADIATVLTGILTLAVPGVSSWRQALPVLKECGAKTVRLAFDADARTNPNVARALGLTVETLTNEGYEVEVETWDPVDGKGIDDLIAAGKQPTVLKGADSAEAVADILDTAGVDLLPRIRADLQDLRLVSSQAVEALKQANDKEPYLFLRGGPARIEPDDDGEMITRDLTPNRLRHEFARVAQWYRYGRNDQEVPAKPPLDIVQDVLAYPKLPFPVLQSIVRAPTFGPDGSLQLAPGYHPASRTYYVPSGEVPDIPQRPTSADVAKAKQLVLDELFGDFPFAADADRAHAVALFLLPFVRSMISGPTPMHLIEASSQGSGKGLLADVALRPALGRAVGIIPPPRDDEELRKSITARLCEGRAAVVLDNVYSLTSAILAAALTAEVWDDRVLGKNETVSLPVRWAWVATGNNATVSTDIARRSIRVRLTPMTDKPWLRTEFRHPELQQWVSQNRGDLIWAALTVIRSWIVAGMPKPQLVPLGSYVSWSNVIGGVLQHIGVQGFLGNIEEFYEIADTEGAVWRQFVAAWWDEHENRSVRVAELYPIAQGVDGFDLGRGSSERSQVISLGKALRRQKDRIFGEFRIELAGSYKKQFLWRLNRFKNASATKLQDKEPF